jgi:polyhydroxybutyrate depolymerase
MRGFLTLAAIGLFAGSASAQNFEKRHWNVEGLDRMAEIHIPPTARTRPSPVVFAFHGHGGLMSDAARDFAIEKHWPEAIVVYPKGVLTVASNDPKGKQSGWQYQVGENGDRDVKFFDTVLASLRQELKVDDQRIHVTGFSNGGGFSYVLWSERGDQIAAFAPCSMQTSGRMISTFKPRPMLMVAGQADTHQKLPDQERVIRYVAELNQCGEGQPWEKKCTLYPSPIGAPVVLYTHHGGHEVPKDAGALIVKFFKKQTLHASTQFEAAAKVLVGPWELNQPTVGSSKLEFGEESGRVSVTEIGLGAAHSTSVTLRDNRLVIHWEANGDLAGSWEFELNAEKTQAAGKAVVVRFKGYEAGEEREIAGRKVRVVEGVTLRKAN